METKVLSVVANPNERLESPAGFGLSAMIEKKIESFLEEVGGEKVSYELVGTLIDAGIGSAQDPQAVFGRTLVVLKYEPGAAPKSKKKK